MKKYIATMVSIRSGISNKLNKLSSTYALEEVKSSYKAEYNPKTNVLIISGVTFMTTSMTLLST